MVDFSNILQYMDAYGFTDVLFPFMLFFALVFAILDKIKILAPGDEEFNRRLSAIVALVFSILAIVPHVTGHYPPGFDIVDIIKNVLPQIAILSVAIIMLLILLGMWGIDSFFTDGREHGHLSGIVVIIVIGIVAYLFLTATSTIPYASDLLNWVDDETKGLLLMICIFGLIVWFITRTPESGLEPAEKARRKNLNALESLGEFIFGKKQP